MWTFLDDFDGRWYVFALDFGGHIVGPFDTEAAASRRMNTLFTAADLREIAAL
jgi:hypothetical protein